MIWGPVATAIVWGLAFSTVLTLFVAPMLYRYFMVKSAEYQGHPWLFVLFAFKVFASLLGILLVVLLGVKIVSFLLSLTL